MLKKIFLLCCVLLLGAVSTCWAADARVSAFNWGINKENKLRVVFDVTRVTQASSKLTDSELTIKVDAKLKNSMEKHYALQSKIVKSMSLEADGDATVLHLPLKKEIKKTDYKLFTLKADPGANRPNRVVLDVYNGPSENIVVAGPSTNNTPRPSYSSTYTVAGGIKGKRITLDAGHGGSDPGTHGIDSGVTEKEITLPITMKVREMLQKKGAIVSMTRTTDVDVYGPDATDAQELQARVDVAENNRADLFISLHCNANNNRDIGGFSTYYHPKTRFDELVAQCIQNRLLKTGNLNDLGIRYANFYVNKRCSMPGALVEMLFLSNRREEKLMMSNWYQTKVAQAIADGIEDFYKQNGGGN